VRLRVLNPESVKRVVQALSDPYPNMANGVAKFLMTADSVCANFTSQPLRFSAGVAELAITVVGAEPILKRIGEGMMIGLDIYLGVTSGGSADEVGQVRILLARGGDSEYQTYLHTDLSSQFINTDRQLLAAVEAVSAASRRLEAGMAQAVKGAPRKGGSGQRPQGRSVERGSRQPRQAQRPPDAQPPQGGRSPGAGQVGSVTRPNIAPGAPAPQPASATPDSPPEPSDNGESQSEGKEDPFSNVVGENIPPLNIETNSDKIKVPPRLFQTKDKEG
jgi:hypothetical protein